MNLASRDVADFSIITLVPARLFHCQLEGIESGKRRVGVYPRLRGRGSRLHQRPGRSARRWPGPSRRRSCRSRRPRCGLACLGRSSAGLACLVRSSPGFWRAKLSRWRGGRRPCRRGRQISSHSASAACWLAAGAGAATAMSTPLVAATAASDWSAGAPACSGAGASGAAASCTGASCTGASCAGASGAAASGAGASGAAASGAGASGAAASATAASAVAADLPSAAAGAGAASAGLAAAGLRTRSRRKPRACSTLPSSPAEQPRMDIISGVALEPAVAGGALGRRTRVGTVRPPRHQRPDLIGQPLQHVDPHRARSAHVKTGDAIEGLRHRLVGRQRGETRARRLGQRLEVEAVRGAVLEGPQRQRQLGRCRLEQRREVDVEGAEAHAVVAQLRAGGLVERAHLLGDGLAAQGAEALAEAESDPARQAP